LGIEAAAALDVEPEQTLAMTGGSACQPFASRLLRATMLLAADAPALHYDIAALREPLSTASHEVVPCGCSTYLPHALSRSSINGPHPSASEVTPLPFGDRLSRLTRLPGNMSPL